MVRVTNYMNIDEARSAAERLAESREAMPQTTNVEIVKRGMDAFNLRDVDAFAALATSDFEWFPALVSVVEGDSYRGPKGLTTDFTDVSDAWEEIRISSHEMRDLGDRVVVLGRVEGRGRGSGVQIDAPLGFVVDIRGGKVSRVRGYLDHDEALRAVGLER